MEARWFTAGAPTRPSASTPLPMPHMLPAPPKSSETRAIMLLHRLLCLIEELLDVESDFKTLLMKASPGAGIRCAPYFRGLIKPVTDFSEICRDRYLH